MKNNVLQSNQEPTDIQLKKITRAMLVEVKKKAEKAEEIWKLQLETDLKQSLARNGGK